MILIRSLGLAVSIAAALGLHGAQLHLILGTTNPYGADQYDAAIASLSPSGKVSIRREIFGRTSGSMDGLGWIDTNDESRRAVILRSGGGDEHTGEMIVIDSDKGDVAKVCGTVRSTVAGLGPVHEYLLRDPLHGLVLAVHFFGEHQSQLVGRIVDPATPCNQSTVILDNTALLRYVSDGSAGVGAAGARNSLVTGFDDHRLISVLGQDRLSFPRLPDDLLKGRPAPTGSSIAARNSALEVFQLSWGTPPVYRYVVHQRAEDRWAVLPIAEDEYPKIRAFGDWLAWQQSPSEKSLQRKRPGVTPVRPGREDFREGKTRWGKAAMYGILTESVYTGILNLYNATTNRHLTFDTKHGDSEVLLISGTTVYYRTSDRLFQMEITGDGISSPKLLAKSELIRDAHWAFLSLEMPPRLNGK